MPGMLAEDFMINKLCHQAFYYNKGICFINGFAIEQ
jgi:hypothetical protein